MSADTEALQDQLAEMASNMEALMLENETLTKIVTADSALTGAVATIKQLTREVESLRERVAGLMEEKNLAIRAARQAQKKVVI